MASTSSNWPSHHSKLLNDYRNNRIGSNLQLTDLGDHVLEFALDPRGSRWELLGERFEQPGLAQLSSTSTKSNKLIPFETLGIPKHQQIRTVEQRDLQNLVFGIPKHQQIRTVEQRDHFRYTPA
uniref:Dioxygenase n=1 Tax=Globodera pallida TaxID=36090 RepID=A0A183BX16_GLOPA